MSEGFNDYQIRIFEALRNAIFSAVANSYDVKSLVRIIREHRMKDDLLYYMDTIEVDELIREAVPEQPAGQQTLALPAREPPAGDPFWDGQYIDGAKLSEREILFEEYCRMHFNEDEWKKRNKIRL